MEITFKTSRGETGTAIIDPEQGTLQLGDRTQKISLAQLHGLLEDAPPRAYGISVSELVFSYMNLHSRLIIQEGGLSEPIAADPEDIYRVKRLLEFLNKAEGGV